MCWISFYRRTVTSDSEDNRAPLCGDVIYACARRGEAQTSGLSSDARGRGWWLFSTITFADYFRSIFPRSISRRPLRHFHRVHSLQEEYRSDICSCRGSIPNLTRICTFLRRDARAGATYPKFRYISRLLLFFNPHYRPTSEITFLTDHHYIYTSLFTIKMVTQFT